MPLWWYDLGCPGRLSKEAPSRVMWSEELPWRMSAAEVGGSCPQSSFWFWQWWHRLRTQDFCSQQIHQVPLGGAVGKVVWWSRARRTSVSDCGSSPPEVVPCQLWQHGKHWSYSYSCLATLCELFCQTKKWKDRFALGTCGKGDTPSPVRVYVLTRHPKWKDPPCRLGRPNLLSKSRTPKGICASGKIDGALTSCHVPCQLPMDLSASRSSTRELHLLRLKLGLSEVL